MHDEGLWAGGVEGGTVQAGIVEGVLGGSTSECWGLLCFVPVAGI